MEINKIYVGKCEICLQGFPENTFDSCVTDPPYGLKFMGKKWDYEVPSIDKWEQIFRVLKPGAHILVACGTKTQHRMAVNIEDAGFEIRDVITWHYGSGFPKSMDISKAIDKAADAEREVISQGKAVKRMIPGRDQDITGSWIKDNGREFIPTVTAPATDEAKTWEGWGTALKPATEFWTLARKPLSEKTIVDNVLKWNTGGINIDECKIEKQEGDRTEYGVNGIQRKNNNNVYGEQSGIIEFDGTQARFPSNVIFDEFTGEILNFQSGYTSTKRNEKPSWAINGNTDAGGASRFFYCAKPDGPERNKGVDPKLFRIVAEHHRGDVCETCGGIIFQSERPSACKCEVPNRQPKVFTGNHHPTIKPIDLMRYLVKLVTPKKGIVLDPFCGSGTTLIGAKMELRNYIGIEMDPEYCAIAEARVSAWNPDKYIPQQLF